jgi:hypothetical protein
MGITRRHCCATYITQGEIREFEISETGSALRYV